MISRRQVLAVRAVSAGIALLAAAGVADSIAGRDVRSAVLAGVVGPVCAAGFWRVARLLDRVRRDFDGAERRTGGAS